MSVATEDIPVENIRITIPELNKGEIYAGSIINPDGNGRHVVLLPGDKDKAAWGKQREWAISIGGKLPDRVEQSLLHDKLPGEFQKTWYWSDIEDADDPAWAWYPIFLTGRQSSTPKSYELRARAVRIINFKI